MSNKEEASISEISNGKYEKREGANRLSDSYMTLMSAFCALKLCLDEDLDDFKLTAYNNKYGTFANLSLDITLLDGSEHTLLLNLKYKEKTGKNITNQHLTPAKGDFSLSSFYKTCSEFNTDETESSTRCIVFTNLVYYTDGEKLKIPELEVSSIENTSSSKFLFLNTNEKNGSCHKFVKCQKEELYFFTNQANIDELEQIVKEMLQVYVGGNIFDTYIYFMEQWSTKKFVLTKQDIIAKLSELAFDSDLEVLNSEKSNPKTELLEEVIMSRQLTIVNSNEDTISKIWTKVPEENPKIKIALQKFNLSATSNFSEIPNKAKYKALWYLGELPLVVKVNEQNINVCKNMAKLFQNQMGEKKIVFVGRISREELSFQGSVFENLSDLSNGALFDKIVSTFAVCLQKQYNINLEVFIYSDKDILKCIRMNELLKMSQEKFYVGNKIGRELPEFHISRTVSITLLNTKEVIEKCNCKDDCLLIINCSKEFGSSQFSNGGNITLSYDDCSIIEFDEICKKSSKSEIHLVKIVDESNCVLQITKGPNLLDRITQCEMKMVGNEDIFKYHSSCLNVLIAPPGEGKSTFLSYLDKICPQNVWSSYVNLRHFVQLFKTKASSEEILCKFLALEPKDQLLCKIRNLLKNRIHLFLDGLDEIDSDCIEYIFTFLKQILSESVKVWVTSRENLQETIIEKFRVVLIVVEPIDRTQQRSYIEKRLKDNKSQQYEDDEIKKIISAIYANIDVIIDEDILKNPLHLHILTKSFVDNYTLYKNIQRQGYFLLTKMFKLLLEGKKEMVHKTTNTHEIERQLGYDYPSYIKSYEIPALKFLLDEDDFQKLNLNWSDSLVFLRQMASEGDKFGIIKVVKMVNEEDEDYEVEFVFRSYAKYFACVWLKEQKNETSAVRDKILAKPKYLKLKRFFDVILANKKFNKSSIYAEIRNYLENF